MEFRYYPQRVCSQEMIFQIEGSVIQEVKIIGGCPGNTKAVAKLIQGMKVQDVISKLKGIDCKQRGTSCPDQLAKALEEYLKKEKRTCK